MSKKPTTTRLTERLLRRMSAAGATVAEISWASDTHGDTIITWLQAYKLPVNKALPTTLPPVEVMQRQIDRRRSNTAITKRWKVSRRALAGWREQLGFEPCPSDLDALNRHKPDMGYAAPSDAFCKRVGRATEFPALGLDDQPYASTPRFGAHGFKARPGEWARWDRPGLGILFEDDPAARTADKGQFRPTTWGTHLGARSSYADAAI